FVIANREELKRKADLESIKKVFKDEFPKAELFFKKNKKLQLKIRKLEAENKIKIARKITLEEFNEALKKWDREDIIV
ncbi:MAG: hypothetical protein ACTSVV_06765, partial [Promethearchaeota archaeon]